MEGAEPKLSLPGVWFNSSEIYALLTMEHLLSNLQPGLLNNQIEPLKARLRILLESGGHDSDEVGDRIRVIHIAGRAADSKIFQSIATGLFSRTRLRIDHHSRGRGEWLEREVSPQRLLFYRDSWYLDAWCHERDAVRSFAVDAMRHAVNLSEPAREVSSEDLDELTKSGYGIFSGKRIQTAVLRFSPENARWVAHERWHSQQQGTFDKEGRYVLRIPYAQDTELIMDILRHGAGVEVLEPATLRMRVMERLQSALAQYHPGGT
ncbi:putative Helix-turn-helix type 11 domain-containing protein [Magnetofaba australis IT-1]|uniref:Putative Helix-turn-helix type 11 domain-containing protein n=1 Tax=Magnetofaba australis IT-1 TaxID=1434232 RepID=A0A1Y2KAD1_9PROT|nr:putative Helix-turn-helix type 11 domain-containing protein [Magnetofaba australis IT-1]